MKNIDLEKLNLVEMTNLEQIEIDGGQDEVTKGFWYFVGQAAGTVYNAWKISSGSAGYHDAMSSSNYGGIKINILLGRK